ncbi:sushi, von Willebrand factor type A, EGF and pentraxin domain-containing protein 1 [Parasteatoda tepidariorum]|uniref:sushi, von Willebrand factor type A, EGF and pentraxin domain-containing protein 1 n=1 Tax=Parasteatoda tepidariorum TaxID=114398 RepID=UPI00077FAECC|nr:sushi, von Willebrand factor type A, EGF and pentraxin domain-containing protein 1 [Parasteatoda tepidariorum]
MIFRLKLIVWILFLIHSEVGGLDCGYPGSPAFGRPYPLKELYRPGDAVTYSCSVGYSQQGPLQRVCLRNGTWSPGLMPLCDRSLSTVDQQASSRQTLSLYPANKSIDGDPNTCAYTDKLRPRWIRLDMKINYRVKAIALTVPQGIYSQDAAQMTIYAISVRDSTTASYHKCASFNGKFAATTLKLTCAGGDVEGRYIHVEDNRHRVDYFSLCEIQVYVNKGIYECGEAERPAHSYSVKTETGAVLYRCIYGYRLVGPTTRVCMSNGQWSLYPPTCIEIICHPLEAIEHGRILYMGRKTNSLTLGTIANATCNYGYRLSGSPLVCTEDGRWSEGQLLCLPIDCGVPSVSSESEQYILLNESTHYGSVAILKCRDLEDTITCREDGTWSLPQIECDDQSGLSKLGLVNEEQNDVPTGIVIGMAIFVFLLLLLVILILLIKRRKVLRQSSVDSLPSKETNSSLTPNTPLPYDNDAFYATIPVDDGTEEKRNIMSTILFTKKKSDSKESSGSSSNTCIYEEIQTKHDVAPPHTIPEEDQSQPVYAQVNLEEKKRSRLVKSLCDRFEPVDPPSWENTYRSEVPPSFDEVDLEPIKLRELPPIPDDSSDASCSTPSSRTEIHQESLNHRKDSLVISKGNETYTPTAKQ